MTDRDFKSLVDDYVRDRLSADDEAAFEEALLEDPELQAAVEVALGIREVLGKQADELDEIQHSAEPSRNPWSGYALAASVALAVISTTLYWQAGVENQRLMEQIDSLSGPVGTVLQVPVNIMRSGSEFTPDVIVQKPDGKAAILLDIELGAQARDASELKFALVDIDDSILLEWYAAPTPDGRTSVVISNAQIPATRLWLQISNTEDVVLERRLLEFRG